MEVNAVVFRPIGFHTALILNRLRNQAQLTSDKEEQVDSDRDAARERANKNDTDRHIEYVEKRLRELAAFERRLGNKKRSGS
jgi:hypothetical protein